MRLLWRATRFLGFLFVFDLMLRISVALSVFLIKARNSIRKISYFQALVRIAIFSDNKGANTGMYHAQIRLSM